MTKPDGCIWTMREYPEGSWRQILGLFWNFSCGDRKKQPRSVQKVEHSSSSSFPNHSTSGKDWTSLMNPFPQPSPFQLGKTHWERNSRISQGFPWWGWSHGKWGSHFSCGLESTAIPNPGNCPRGGNWRWDLGGFLAGVTLEKPSRPPWSHLELHQHLLPCERILETGDRIPSIPPIPAGSWSNPSFSQLWMGCKLP